MRDRAFTFKCDEVERLTIRVLADRLQRTESDAVRWVVVNAARELCVIPSTASAQVHEGEAQHVKPSA